MRKTRRRKKKKTRLCARIFCTIITILSLAIAFSISLSVPATFLFRIYSRKSFRIHPLRPYRGMLDTWQNCVLIPFFPFFVPWTSRRNYYCCSVYSLFSPFLFLRLVSHDNYFSYFSLVYTSLYLVKFSKFTIKITYGFFFVSQVVTISPCVTNTQCALANECSYLSFSHFLLSFPSFTHFLTLALSCTISHTQSLPFTLTLCVFFFF